MFVRKTNAFWFNCISSSSDNSCNFFSSFMSILFAKIVKSYNGNGKLESVMEFLILVRRLISISYSFLKRV